MKTHTEMMSILLSSMKQEVIDLYKTHKDPVKSNLTKSEKKKSLSFSVQNKKAPTEETTPPKKAQNNLINLPLSQLDPDNNNLVKTKYTPITSDK
jgi:hypothetical protein